MASNPQHQRDALQFAIDFAQTPIASADLKAISDRVRQFFVGAPDPEVKGKPMSLDALTAAQTHVRGLLRGIVANNVPLVDLQLRAQIVRLHQRDPRVFVNFLGELSDRFLYRVIRLLEELGVEKLRECPAPECGRLFFKVTRKEFCSTRCQSRVYMRIDRKRKKLLEKPERKTPHGKTTRTR